MEANDFRYFGTNAWAVILLEVNHLGIGELFHSEEGEVGGIVRSGLCGTGDLCNDAVVARFGEQHVGGTEAWVCWNMFSEGVGMSTVAIVEVFPGWLFVFQPRSGRAGILPSGGYRGKHGDFLHFR